MNTPTLDQFAIYELVRESGVTNMFDVKTVIAVAEEEYDTELDKDIIVNIMQNYDEYLGIYEYNRDTETLDSPNTQLPITSPVLKSK